MGFIRVCVCGLLLVASISSIGACSGDDDGGSSGAACHCDWGDTCDETPSPCSQVACSSTEEGEIQAPGACSQTDVIGRCDCPYDEVTYYRSSFVGDPAASCTDWCDGVYEAL